MHALARIASPWRNAVFACVGRQLGYGEENALILSQLSSFEYLMLCHFSLLALSVMVCQ